MKLRNEENAGASTPARRLFRDLPFWSRIAMHLAGPAAVFVVAGALLGPWEAMQCVASGYRQLMQGVLSPRVEGIRLLSRFFGLLDQHRYAVAAGILASKMVAVNLLPLTITNGGMVLLELLAWVRRKHLNDRTSVVLAIGSLITLLILIGGWGVALAGFLYRLPALR